MDIWLLRHAKAEESSDSGRDEDRALTRGGTRRAAAVARGLAALDPGIEAILTSPYRRARETAAPAARALGIAKVTDSRSLEPGRAPSDVVEELEAGGWRAALLVGHQPLLGSIVAFLVFGDERREIPLRKASVAHVSWTLGANGTLEGLLPAEVLVRLGASG
ncbi:MAG TPA: phosphohistidine phosphatase SixA [Thermoanaerobaculia bacterium]|jgi:phosphohistidine phosphatase